MPSLLLLTAWKPTSWLELAKAIADLPSVSRLLSISPMSSACTSGAAAPPRLRSPSQNANHSAMSFSANPSLPSAP